MAKLAFTAVIECAVKGIGDKLVYEAAQYALGRRAAFAGRTTRDLLREHGLTYLWTVSVNRNKTGRYKVDSGGLAECVVKLGIPLDELFEIILAPWSTLQPNPTVVGLVGCRPASVGRSLLLRQSNSAFDTEALAEMQHILRTVRIDSRLQVVPVNDRTSSTLRDVLKLKHGRIDAVVAFGSEKVNILSGEILETALSATDIGVTFNFAEPPVGGTFCAKCDPKDEGIVISGSAVGEKRFFPREHDQSVMAKLNKITSRSPLEALANLTFPDVGLLGVDATGSRLQIAAMGHSGLSTLECVKALNSQSKIAAALENRVNRKKIAVFIVEILRRKQTLNPVDDFETASCQLHEISSVS